MPWGNRKIKLPGSARESDWIVPVAIAIYAALIACLLSIPFIAHAACDPAAGWAAGTACTPADRVGVRLGSADQSLQAAINSGTIGRGLTARTVTGTVTLAAGDLAQVNTTSGAFAVTLPSAPADGSVLEIVDAAGTFDTNQLTINRGGADTIEGATSKVISVEYAYVRLSYDANLARWQMLDEAGGGGSGDVIQVWTVTSGDVSSLTAGAGDTLDAGAASAASPCSRSTTLPATCTEGQCHQDTDSGNLEIHWCTAPNTWTKGASLADAGGGGGVPGAEYIVGALDGTLSAERLVTNTPTVTWDLTTPGQAQANVAQHAGTDVTVDLEEETHANEHNSGGTDPLTVSNLAGSASDAQVSGSGESDEVTMGGDLSGAANAAQIAAGAVGTSEAAALDAGDTTTGTFGAARIPALDTLTGTAPAAAKITDGVRPDIALIATTTCPMGSFHDVDRSGGFDFATDRCVTPDEIKWARNYNGPGSTTQGINEAVASCLTGSSAHGCIVGLRMTDTSSPIDITTQIVVGSENVNANRQSNVKILGVGGSNSAPAAGTWIRYVGSSMAADEGVIQITGNDNALIGFSIDANNLADYGVHVEGQNTTSSLSNGGSILQVGVNGARVAGIQFGDTNYPANDVQADLWNLQDLKIHDQRTSGDIMDYCVRSSQTNAVKITINNMECSGYASIGVYAEHGQITVNNSSILVPEGLQRNAALWGVARGSENTAIMQVTGNWFEADNGGCFNQNGLTVGYAPFTFTDNNCIVGGGTGGTENTSSHFIYYGASPLVLTGNSFSERTGRNAPPTDRVIIGNFSEGTVPLKVLDFANDYGGTGGMPTFAATYQHGVVPNHVAAIPAAAPDASGEFAYDSTANDLEYGDNGTNRKVANLDEAQTFSGAKTITGVWDFSGNLLTTTDIDDATLDDDLLPFDDADNVWTAAQLGPALEELNNSINAGVPNGAGAKTHWSQLLGVPAGFSDGTDDGGGASLPVVDTTSIAEGSGDVTKEMRIEVDGITTGTVRVLTMPDANVDLGALGASNLAAGSLTAADAAADLATQAELDAKSAASSTDNAVARFDSTAGDVQNSGVTIDDSNNVDGIGTLDADGAISGTSLAADPTPTPSIALEDSNSPDDADDDNDAAILAADMTDVTGDSVDSKLEISVQVADVVTEIAQIDGTGLTVVGTAAATTVTGANVTSGADPGHTHTGSSVSGLDISADTNLAATGPISLSGDTVTTSMATNKLLGRGTAATGVAEEITLGTNLSFTGTTLNAAGGGGSVNAEEGNAVVVTATTALDFLGADFDVAADAGEADVVVAAALTRDAEWDTIAEIEAAIGSLNVLLATEADTSAELRGILTDETGTGAGMFGLTTAMADDIGCTGLQSIRRNSGDTAFECLDSVTTAVGLRRNGDPAGGYVAFSGTDIQLDNNLDGLVDVSFDSASGYTIYGGVSSMIGYEYEGAPNAHEQRITFTDPTGDRFFVVPDLGDATSVLMVQNPSQALSGDHTIEAGGAFFGGNGIIFEGATADLLETFISITDPTADRTVTVPNADSTTVQPDAGASNNFLTAISSSGVISKAQPAFSDLSGSATDGQVPNAITVDEAGIAAAIARDTETCGGGACAVGSDDTVTLTQSAAPAPTAEGRAEWETDDDHLIVGDGAAQVEFVPAEDMSGDATQDDAGAVTLAAGITRDTEWDTEGEVQTAWGAVNILLATEIDASSELRALMGDENGTGAALFAGATYVDSSYVPAGSMDVDGTQCTKAAAAVINSGPMILAINCADSASGIVYLEVGMPDGWNASGAITVEAQAYTVDASVTGGTDDTVGWDVSCMARGDGETINSTWGSAVDLDVTFATQYVEEHVTSAAITPNDYEAGDTLYCRAVIDTTTTDATTADMRLKGFKLEFTRALGD